MKCECGGEVHADEGYTTIFRCKACNKVGSEKDFIVTSEDEKEIEDMMKRVNLLESIVEKHGLEKDFAELILKIHDLITKIRLKEHPPMIIMKKEIMDEVKAAGIEQPFNEMLDKMAAGDFVGERIETIEDLRVKLLCAECGSEKIMWFRMDDEAHYKCRQCGNKAWMSITEYMDAIKKNHDIVFWREDNINPLEFFRS